MMSPLPCFAVVGWKNSGKTTLVARLVEHLTNQGLVVSTLKHAHHSFDLDREGTDSFAHRTAGASEVVLVSAGRWAIQHELKEDSEPSVWDMLERMSACDLVIVEGYKNEPLPKIEILANDQQSNHLWTQDDNVLAIAADHEISDCPLPRFRRDDIDAITKFIVNRIGKDD